MNIKVRNLGAIKQAELTLGDMTILCGKNNTGKTYVTYALYGFLSFWRDEFAVPVDDSDISKLLNDGVVHISYANILRDAESILHYSCKQYTEQLYRVFAGKKERFKDAEFQISLNPGDIQPSKKYERNIGSADINRFSITKDVDCDDIVVTLLVEKGRPGISREIIRDIIGNAIKEIIFGSIFPNTFIASAERTGASMFGRELDFKRTRLLKEIMSPENKDTHPMSLFLKEYQDYPLPVEKNVDFIRSIGKISNRSSYVSEKHPDVLDDFKEIIGGEYSVTQNDGLLYTPSNSKGVKLAMGESSSAVRSLCDIGFYLRHEAKEGDLLIVDEPELNLHPENQRKVARLFARLVNIGIKVFITTHSDYIIKELNTLIMLNHDKPHLKRIEKEYGYKKEELIFSSKIKVYKSEESLILLAGHKRKSNMLTLVPADIDPEYGIKADTFDDTINKMNQIQDEIIWGEE